MPYLPNFLGVSFNEGGTHGPDPLVPGYLFDQTSGFAASTEVFIELALSTTATMDVVLRTDQLPTDFDIASSRVFFGTYDDTLFCMGLFVSQIGLAFGGAYDDNPYVIPGTASLVQTGQTYAARLVLSPTQEAVYVYWSEMGEAIAAGGPALVAVLPLLSSQDVPSHLEGAYFSVRGSSSRPVRVSLLSWCLASVALMQDLPPVADAGVNQAVARCAAVRLDGSGSYDPEGGALTYLWKLIDGPASSGYIDEGQDGETQASVSGFVTKLYSSHAAGGDAFDVSAGDILLVGGTPYVLVGTGSDIDGDYFEITTETLPESLPSVAFKVVRQSGFLSSNEQKVTFLPDVSGLYRFQLKVSDGSLTSSPSETMADVRAISAPRGVVPNTTFLWDQMSDVSRLLEDGGRIEALWEGVLQCVGAVLLAAWGIDDNKSLQTISDLVARKWLHYDLLLKEPFGYLSSVRYVGKGVASGTFAGSGLDIDGDNLILSIPYLSELLTVTFSAAHTSPALVKKHLEAELRKIDTRFAVELVPMTSTSKKVVISAPFPFTVVAGSDSPWTVGASNTPLEGTQAQREGPTSISVDADLRGLPLKTGDLILLKTTTGLVAVRYESTIPYTGPLSEFFPPDRFTVKLLDPVPSGLEGGWVLALQLISPQLNFWEGGVQTGDPAVVEIADPNEETIFLRSPVGGLCEGAPNVLGIYPDALLLPYLAAPARYLVEFWGVYRRHTLPVDDLVMRIPFLQPKLRSEEEELLRENVDYTLDTFRGRRCITFVQDVWVGDPLVRLWAEYTYLSNAPAIEANFGGAVGLTREQAADLPNNTQYLSAVRGLWYAYFRGPRVANLRIGAQVLLGLPFAEKKGTITDIDTSYSSSEGRIVLTELAPPQKVRTYYYPRALSVETNVKEGRPYEVGDTVEQFAPLVRGVDVVDYVNEPEWISPYVAQGLRTEIDKFHTFLVRVSLEAFSLPSLLFIQSFLHRIKPLRTKPLFLVRKTEPFLVDVDVVDSLAIQARLHLQDNPHMLLPWAPEQEYPVEHPRKGFANAYDHQDASPSVDSWMVSGHIANSVDTDIDPENALPGFPNPDLPTGMARDLGNIRPEAFVTAKASIDYNGSDPMTLFEDLAEADQPLLQGDSYRFGQQWVVALSPAGMQLRDTQTASGPVSVDYVQVTFQGTPPSGGEEYVIRIFVDDVEQVALTVTHATAYDRLEFGPAPAPVPLATPFSILIGQVVRVTMEPSSGDPVAYTLKAVTVILGNGVSWSPGGPALPAGVYYVLRTL
jgi:hypothetical protein